MFSIEYSKQFLSYRILKSNRFKYIWQYGLGQSFFYYSQKVQLAWVGSRAQPWFKTWKVLFPTGATKKKTKLVKEQNKN